MKQCNKEKNILLHRFVYACACSDVAFTASNTLVFCINMSMLPTILHMFCILFKIYCRLFGHTPARILYPRHPCGSTFTCFEKQEQHIIPKVGTFYAKALLVIGLISLILKLKNFWITVSQNQLSN